MGSRYARGSAFEQALARTLRSHGLAVVRSAGSKGPADLIVGFQGQVALVQAKAGGHLSQGEASALKVWAKAYGASAWLAQKGRPPTMTLVWPEVPSGFILTLNEWLALAKARALPKLKRA